MAAHWEGVEFQRGRYSFLWDCDRRLDVFRDDFAICVVTLPEWASGDVHKASRFAYSLFEAGAEKDVTIIP